MITSRSNGDDDSWGFRRHGMLPLRVRMRADADDGETDVYRVHRRRLDQMGAVCLVVLSAWCLVLGAWCLVRGCVLRAACCVLRLLTRPLIRTALLDTAVLCVWNTGIKRRAGPWGAEVLVPHRALLSHCMTVAGDSCIHSTIPSIPSRMAANGTSKARTGQSWRWRAITQQLPGLLLGF